MTSKRATTPTSQRPVRAYVTIDEAAEIMSTSTVTVRRRISDGSLPAYKCGRRLIRIRVDDIDAAMKRIPSTGM